MSKENFLLPHSNYAELLSFQKAEEIYDLTFRFAHKFLSRGDRTVDQMIQSARSGKKNILEGSKAALTSKETEIKLINVARASLEELLDDYKDYLRARDLKIWDKEPDEAEVRFGSVFPAIDPDFLYNRHHVQFHQDYHEVREGFSL
jgi:four helix bundle protein